MAWQTFLGGSRTTGTWLRHIRKRVDFASIDAEAGRDVELLVTGPGASAFVDVLAHAGVNEPALRACSSLPDPRELPAFTRAVVMVAGDDPVDPSIQPPAWRRPLYIVQPPRDASAQTSAAAPQRPTADAAATYTLSALTLSELHKHVLPDIVLAYAGLEIPLAAKIPAFRSVVAARLTLGYAMSSLKIAGASALADHIPLIGLITGGIASAGDTIAITALQMRMLLQIAACYGKKAEFARIIELLPVLGGGYGWRALAREASGFIPIAGIAIKAGIAYAGTLVVGQAASYYYETGSKMPPHAISALYREASERARGTALQLAARATGKDDQRHSGS